jgi:hypothetical protein
LNSSVRVAKTKPHFTVTKINWLTLFKEIIAVYSELHFEHVNTKNEELLIAKASGTLSPIVFKGLVYGSVTSVKTKRERGLKSI